MKFFDFAKLRLIGCLFFWVVFASGCDMGTYETRFEERGKQLRYENVDQDSAGQTSDE